MRWEYKEISFVRLHFKFHLFGYSDFNAYHLCSDLFYAFRSGRTHEHGRRKHDACSFFIRRHLQRSVSKRLARNFSWRYRLNDHNADYLLRGLCDEGGYLSDVNFHEYGYRRRGNFRHVDYHRDQSEYRRHDIQLSVREYRYSIYKRNSISRHYQVTSTSDTWTPPSPG